MASRDRDKGKNLNGWPILGGGFWPIEAHLTLCSQFWKKSEPNSPKTPVPAGGRRGFRGGIPPAEWRGRPAGGRGFKNCQRTWKNCRLELSGGQKQTFLFRCSIMVSALAPPTRARAEEEDAPNILTLNILSLNISCSHDKDNTDK